VIDGLVRARFAPAASRVPRRGLHLLPWSRHRTWLWPVAVVLVLLPRVSAACDVCAIYTATEMREEQLGLGLGIAEQFTDFSTLQQDGVKVPNPYDEHMFSSITDFIFSYNFTHSLGAEVLVPYIARPFRRITSSGIQSGDVNGFGDIIVLGDWIPYSYVNEHGLVLPTLLLGVKMPTGNPALLGQESGAPTDPHCFPGFPCGTMLPSARGSGARFVPFHSGTGPPSGIHGHDLALGSGSTDVLLGTTVFGSYNRLYAKTFLEYAIRTEGAFNYQFANEIIWDSALGVYVLLDHAYTGGVQLGVLVESKGNDTINGVSGGDTGMTAIYLGPGFTFTWKSNLGASLVFDFPTLQNNTGLQVVPTFRVRGGITWRF